MALNILLQGFCPMKIKIFDFLMDSVLKSLIPENFELYTSKSFFAVLGKFPGQWRLEVTTFKKIIKLT